MQTRQPDNLIGNSATWDRFERRQLQADGACIPAESFTAVTFDNATLRRSNLGGLGGRCDETAFAVGMCELPQTESTPHEIFIVNVGRAPNGARIDLRITNETEYRAWRLGHNGIKRERQRELAVVGSGSSFGYFAVVNLLGPRSVTQQPASMWWNDAFTFVQLLYEFLDSTEAPLTIGRTFLSFYDFDTGLSQVTGAVPAVECMQIGPQAIDVRLPNVTEIQQMNQVHVGTRHTAWHQRSCLICPHLACGWCGVLAGCLRHRLGRIGPCDRR